jgi:transcriptional regulator with XRE-family HTH domain
VSTRALSDKIRGRIIPPGEIRGPRDEWARVLATVTTAESFDALLGGFSRREFMRRTGVSKETLIGWAKGARARPGTIRKVATALGREPGEVEAVLDRIAAEARTGELRVSPVDELLERVDPHEPALSGLRRLLSCWRRGVASGDAADVSWLADTCGVSYAVAMRAVLDTIRQARPGRETATRLVDSKNERATT